MSTLPNTEDSTIAVAIYFATSSSHFPNSFSMRIMRYAKVNNWSEISKKINQVEVYNVPGESTIPLNLNCRKICDCWNNNKVFSMTMALLAYGMLLLYL